MDERGKEGELEKGGEEERMFVFVSSTHYSIIYTEFRVNIFGQIKYFHILLYIN